MPGSVPAVVALVAALASAAGADPAVRVELRTERGPIEIEVETARAPLTAANFLRYMDVVRAIQGSPADGQHLTPPVRIRAARRPTRGRP